MDGARAATTGALPVGLAPRTRQLVSDYVELTKPKVQSLLLLTTIATMYVAGDPSPGLVALTCLGGYLSAGGAGAVNHWFDFKIVIPCHYATFPGLVQTPDGFKAKVKKGEVWAPAPMGSREV